MAGENSRHIRQIKAIVSILNIRMFVSMLASIFLASCFKPPFNDFKSTMDNFAYTLIQPGEKTLIRTLQKQDIQYVEYGDTMTLLVPTDHYFVKGSATINDICYDGLNNIVRLLKFYPKCRIHVAAFGDSIGTTHHKYQLTKARAEAMLTFLWASNISARYMKAVGYGDLFAIGDNQFIHGPAYNRRIEIQWSKICNDDPGMKIAAADMKK
jgi:outer membrane protein OmpA-like peptidoglycan-associated protein